MRPGATSTAAPTAPPRGLDQRSNRRGAQLGSQQQRLWGVSGDVCPIGNPFPIGISRRISGAQVGGRLSALAAISD